MPRSHTYWQSSESGKIHGRLRQVLKDRMPGQTVQNGVDDGRNPPFGLGDALCGLQRTIERHIRILAGQIPRQRLEQSGLTRLPGRVNHKKLLRGDQSAKLRQPRQRGHQIVFSGNTRSGNVKHLWHNFLSLVKVMDAQRTGGEEPSRGSRSTSSRMAGLSVAEVVPAPKLAPSSSPTAGEDGLSR